MIKKLSIEDINAVAQAQMELVPDSYLSRLGQGFLSIYYHQVCRSSFSAGFVYVYNEKIAGYMTATEDSSRLLKDVFKHNFFELIMTFFIVLIRNPKVFLDGIKLIFFIVFDRQERANKIKAELNTFGVLPEYRSRDFFRETKIKISKELFEKCIEFLRKRGIGFVKVSTRSDNAAINNFYKKMGFEVKYTYRSPVIRYDGATFSYMNVLDINKYFTERAGRD
ncbi:MAG: hypothetical protein COV72_02125 [Candidatus Omnitrophica bacterium CG11_big_fil_rev_8_21_14_0_20_42_13]|uniref:N-acetyltransferase domain-containing protein n=1 Tax=Candidatus Ghiorseimicrobium undicola TaxID=1974746 RepID=A0A2H0LYY0_9BACT|nr:MAG: hypothetical protein COV72_02125 [Candidatus Omnitrophica bacterium CG11_big_fil_rev_8_21_14_0_20_42_13]